MQSSIQEGTSERVYLAKKLTNLVIASTALYLIEAVEALSPMNVTENSLRCWGLMPYGPEADSLEKVLRAFNAPLTETDYDVCEESGICERDYFREYSIV
ncbi:hypothetical protein EVAR_35924_1 [Eumeta japonica]|uniref:Uncharacterized protein n=1 Tax=Eumeta variegata TaxID=151549 RepID=A0A4C1W6E5_EUMVA|nr:hypothetical protein EVAR_35924_1 [Eumeta japonica]